MTRIIALFLAGIGIGAGLLVAQAAAEPAAPASQPAVKVSLEKAELVATGDKPELLVKLRLAGEAARTATAIGGWKVTEARDNAGKAVAFIDQPRTPDGLLIYAGSKGFLSLLQAESRAIREPKGNALIAAVHLAAPEAGADRIASLKGELHLMAGGQTKEMQIDKLAEKGNGAIEDPALKDAGVEVTIQSIKEGTDAQPGAVVLAIKGNIAAISSMELVDGKTEHSQLFGHQGAAYFVHHGAVDAKSKVRVTVVVGQQDVTVPFEVKDIPIPQAK